MKHAWLYSDLLWASKGEPLSSGFSTGGSLISASALPYCGGWNGAVPKWYINLSPDPPFSHHRRLFFFFSRLIDRDRGFSECKRLAVNTAISGRGRSDRCHPHSVLPLNGPLPSRLNSYFERTRFHSPRQQLLF